MKHTCLFILSASTFACAAVKGEAPTSAVQQASASNPNPRADGAEIKPVLPSSDLPKDSGAMAAFERASAASRNGDDATAEAALKDALARDPHLDLALTSLGVLYERKQNLSGAENAYRSAIAQNPEQQMAWENLVRLFCRKNQCASVEMEIRAALEKSPDSKGLRNALALSLLQQKKWDLAAAEAKKVLKVDERNVRAMQHLAQACEGQGKLELAKMVLENARAIDAGNAVTHNALGHLYLKLKLRPAAQEAFLKATTLQPDYAEAQSNYGALLNEAQDYPSAVKALERAVSSAPDYLPARMNLANAYRGTSEFDKALEQYKKIAGGRPELADTYFNLAILFLDSELPNTETLDRLKQSVAYFHAYRERGGDDERVAQYLKDAQKGIDKEVRKRERVNKDQLKKAATDVEPASASRPAKTSTPHKGKHSGTVKSPSPAEGSP